MTMTSASPSPSPSVLLLCLLLMACLIGGSHAARINRSAFLDNVAIRSEFIDPNNRTIWDMFNLTEEQRSRIRAGSNASVKDETTQASNNQLLNHIRVQRLNEIRTRIESAVSNKSDDSKDPAGNGNGQKKPFHEMAGYPICNAEASAIAWQQSNNLTLQFASSIFERRSENLHLESAILRLYKMNPKANGIAEPEEEGVDKATTPACVEPLLESQIRVTVSIVLQLKKKQRKKRICNTMMLSTTKTGWVDIDIKCAIQYWEQQQQQQQPQQPPIMVGLLMLEVHDDEENQLKPGLYFLPPKCEQAGIAVPWSCYGSKKIMLSAEDDGMPGYPRLDIRLTGYGSFTPKNFDIDTYRNPIEILKRQFYNLPKSREHINVVESTTSNSPTVDNLLENNSENNGSKESLEQIHQHRRRHHHSQPESVEGEESHSSSGSAQSQSEPHHTHHQRSRSNHHHHHNHHKHRHCKHTQE